MGWEWGRSRVGWRDLPFSTHKIQDYLNKKNKHVWTLELKKINAFYILTAATIFETIFCWECRWHTAFQYRFIECSQHNLFHSHVSGLPGLTTLELASGGPEHQSVWKLDSDRCWQMASLCAILHTLPCEFAIGFSGKSSEMGIHIGKGRWYDPVKCSNKFGGVAEESPLWK